jgi:FdrA protein
LGCGFIYDIERGGIIESKRSMVTKGIIKKGEYYDSVTLMNVAKKLSELPGVIEAAIVMGTKENRAILKSTGLLLPEFEVSVDSDLLIVVKTESNEIASNAINSVDSILKKLKETKAVSGESNPRSIESAIKILPEANLAMISIAGKYAGDEAMKALQQGLHVMLFSDNVSFEKEIELKQYAREKGLLVMGPDCGTAIINGVPLAFANVVNRGNIGIVAAAGTGLQETSCLISNAGGGISQAIGTGGRDVGKEVGGLMFIEAVKTLSNDNDTKVILLVSKPPHESVINKIAEIVMDITKPVVAVFLGASSEQTKSLNANIAFTLEEAAFAALEFSLGLKSDAASFKIKERDARLVNLAKSESNKLKREQKYIRGLFSGGTFCSEAQVLLKDKLADIYSNAPIKSAAKLNNSFKSEKHTLIDLGADEFTVGRPHPMIDYSLRTKRLVEEARDGSVAVILLDIVLGYGSNLDPLKEIIPAINQARSIATENSRYLSIICSVTGTDNDPQNRSHVVKGLGETGVLVMESNASASLLAGYIAKEVAR